jgi:hypothetical protein
MFFIKWLRMGAIISLLLLNSGCAWYQSLEWTHQAREDQFPKRSLRDQTPEMQRFYQLQERIDVLEAKVRKQDEADAVDGNARAEQVLSYVRERTRAAIALIERLLEQMEPPAVSDSDLKQTSVVSSEPVPVAADESGEPVEKPAIAGALDRDDQGRVVGSTADGNRYNYSVVYVYPEIQPWFDMWALLDENGVSDKWRGQNLEKDTYFIYVGAYYTESPARNRSNSLLSLTGMRPEIRTRQGYQPVAMQ